MKDILVFMGWCIPVVISCYLTLVWLFAAMNNCGTYNIGGCPNSKIKQIVTILCLIPLYFVWDYVISIAPFTFSMK